MDCDRVLLLIQKLQNAMQKIIVMTSREQTHHYGTHSN